MRVFWNPTPFVANPLATYKILVNGRVGRLPAPVDRRPPRDVPAARRGERLRRRHLGPEHQPGSPGRQAPAGVSLATNPFLDLATLSQYKTVVFNSTVGLNAAGLSFTEFTNLQAYVRAGGGFVAIHGATDSMQNVPWYMDLVGAGFTQPRQQLRRDPDRHRVGRPRGARQRRPEQRGHQRHPGPVLHGRGAVQHEPRPGRARDRAPARVRERGHARRSARLRHRRAHNSDKHAMSWCRNFDGGRSFTTHPRPQLAVRDPGLVPAACCWRRSSGLRVSRTSTA